MVGVTRYDLPVVDVILERSFTIQDTQGAERLCSKTIGGRLSGHRIDAKNRPRGTGSLWMRCRSTGFHSGITNINSKMSKPPTKNSEGFVFIACLCWTNPHSWCGAETSPPGCEIAVTSHWFPISLV